MRTETNRRGGSTQMNGRDGRQALGDGSVCSRVCRRPTSLPLLRDLVVFLRHDMGLGTRTRLESCVILVQGLERSNNV